MHPSHRPEAVFTGLQPGRYTLRLNASNVSGIWSPHVRTLSVVIRSPWWATWWACGLYTIVVAGIAYGLFRMYINRLNLQQSVQLRQKEAEQLRETNAMKTRFFANITHEFRTPLTLILAPAEQLIGEALEPRIHRRLLTIEQNAQQLLRLINQLLDLSRLDASVMPVHESIGDLTQCVHQWLQPLVEQSTTQAIMLSFRSGVSGSHWFDQEKFERIVYNLTANALKFTQTGTITVSLAPATNGIILTVSDTGVGVPAQQLPHIFDRFYRVNSSWAVSKPGTGIGLALVKELIVLQRGRIDVDSQVGQGTTFVVELPYKSAGLTGLTGIEESGHDAETPATPVAPVPPTPSATDKPVVLIVEDNYDLAQFIAENLPASYRTHRAVDGLDGLEQALTQLPDLIISDVMMPGMDGFTLCGQLKTDLRTSHIPLILLTAKVTMENRLAGLGQGADDYLTKPFHVGELRLRVHNLLLRQQRLRAWVRQSLTQVSEPATPPPAQDPFLTQLYAVLDESMGQSDLTVDQLAGTLAVSSRTLHRKLTALTGMTANELVRSYRLRQAARLLQSGQLVSAVAYQVGFENGSYFSKCFKEQFGISPSDYLTGPSKP